MDSPFKGHRLLAILWYLSRVFRDRAKRTTIRPIPMQSSAGRLTTLPVSPNETPNFSPSVFYICRLFSLARVTPPRSYAFAARHLFRRIIYIYRLIIISVSFSFYIRFPNTKNSAYQTNFDASRKPRAFYSRGASVQSDCVNSPSQEVTANGKKLAVETRATADYRCLGEILQKDLSLSLGKSARNNIGGKKSTSKKERGMSERVSE